MGLKENMDNKILIATVFEKGKYLYSRKAEVAVCGRSNCGKSTLINGLLGKKSMARASSKPGKTMSINFYNYDDKVVLADLPGYGYAKVPLSVKQIWKEIVEDYLGSREQLAGALILSDVRRCLEFEEIQLINWLKDKGIQPHIVLTKIDKLSSSELSKAKRDILAQVSNLWQDMDKEIFLVSANKGTGIEELKKKLRAYRKA